MKNKTTTATDSNDNATATTEDKTITNAQFEAIVAALSLLHPIVSTYGGRWPLPAFEACGEEEYRKILTRAEKALVEKGETKRSNTAGGVRGAVSEVIESFRTELNAKRAKLSAFVAANPDMAGTVSIPNAVDAPLFSLLTAFPTETTDAEAMLILKDLGYEVAVSKSNSGTGDKRKKDVVQYSVRVSFEAPKAATTATTESKAA